MEYRSLDPTTGKLLERFPFARDAEVEAALAGTASFFGEWSRTAPADRSAALERIAGLLEQRRERLADRMAVEMGKPLSQGLAEVDKCALGCRVYARRLEEYLAESLREGSGGMATIRHEPLGPILAIMPWNYPFWQFFRFAAPALAAGNTILLKHAPGTPGCALEIEALLLDAGLDASAAPSLFLSHEQVPAVLADRRVRGVTLTGSTRAGRAVASLAGRHLKTMVMELGGSDPFIVFDDADLERAVTVGAAARCQNSGQSCIAAKRFFVQRGVYERFAEGLTAALLAMRVGDPRRAETAVGPLARDDLRKTLAAQVYRTVELGARVRCGGEPDSGAGFFYPPTVLDAPSADSPAARQELFGPVAALFPFATEEEAVALANGTDYGLGASVWTGDAERAQRVARAVEAGNVFINDMVRSDPEWPFGGVKDSGFGRELAREGIVEFVNVKTVHAG